MIRRTIISLATVAAALLVANASLAQGHSPRSIPGEVIVRWKRDAGPSERASLRAQMNAQRVREFKFIEAEHLRLPQGQSADDLIRRFRNHPRIEYVEPNYEITADVVPNDPRFPELYGMRNIGQTGGTTGADIKAVNAWDLFTGDPDLKIGVIDTGVDTAHVDLKANLWTNPGEIPGNAIDDDNNGFVDDVHGYDFVNNDGIPFDDNGHGSHCAGTIAGVGNNSIGVVGVCWRAKIVGIKFLSAAGSGSTAGAISSVQYAITVGVRLTSNSWGGGGFSQALLDAINAAGAAGQLFVAAAGNSSQNTDLTPHYPSSYNSPYIISVAATDNNDNLASFSNYGATSVDLAAPGVSILSIQPGGGFQLLSGTSMATPHVSGAVALAMGRFPNASNLQIKQLVLNAVDVKASLDNRCVTEGRLNAFMTIAEPDSTAPGAVSDLATVNPASNSIGLAWTATGDDGGVGRASSYEIRYSTSPITDEASFLAATPVPGGPDPQPAGSAESFEVGGLDFSTTYYFALRAKDEFGNAGPVSNVAAGTTLGIPNAFASPTSFSASLLTGGQASQTLTLSNTAAGTLDFTIPTPELQFSQPAPYEPLPVEKGQDTRVGAPVTAGHGGPDGAGYRWRDSNEAGGPVFSWIDISAIGTQIPLTVDDGFSASLPMGMSFPFYGGAFSTMRVHTNGFISFTTTSGAFDGNQPLPTTGAAANLVAPFWDDLDFRAAQAPNARAYYHNDGARTVVSWVNVPGFNGIGGPYTFQAILHSSGEIVFQYLSMGSPTNSATTGVQDGTRTIGLNVAFNTPYVQNNLAVRVLQLNQWLRVTPTSGRILAGQSQDLQLTMDATGLFGGDYTGTVHILSNDPDGSPTDVTASLHVTGAPDIAASPASLDYGQVFVGAHPTRSVLVNNPGTDVLNVTVLSSDPTLTTDAAAFTLAAREARNLVVTYSPTTTTPLSNASITLQSNDPDTPNLVIPVTGEGVPAPQFSVTPEQLGVTLLSNTSTTQNLRVSNDGGSNYVFTAKPLPVASAGTVTVYDDDDNVELEKGQADVQFGPTPLRVGGPDGFGYTYQDSDEASGPVFAWVDISGTGTAIPLNGDDQNLGPFPIGFGFPYYGNNFPTFRICSNGWLSFTSNRTNFTNTALPNSGSTIPENLLAAFWDDLDYRPASAPNARAYYQYDGTKLIVQFHNVPRRLENGTTATNTFQVLLHPDGTIVYQYLTMNAVLKTSATIGIQNAAKNDGLQVVFNAAYIKNGLAIRFRPRLTVAPAAGSVPPGGFVDLTVGFDASRLNGGLYPGTVRIEGNDPVLPLKDVPANMTVIGVPDIAAAPASIDFGTSYIGYPQLRQITVTNVGTDVLHVTDITFDDPVFGVDQTSFNLPPLGNSVLFVSFNPVAVGAHNATMTIASDDPDTPNKAVPVTGLGLVAPDVRPDPTSLSATITVPGSETRSVTIHNDGGSNLDFVVGTAISATSVPVYEALELGKEEPDPRAGILGSGGPDLFGYTWRDSDEPGGPLFDWVDITAIGTPLDLPGNGDDQNVQNIPIGFDFPFYGTNFNTVNLCTNGWISFTSTSTSLSNQPLPNTSTSVPNNLLAAFWDDLDPDTLQNKIWHWRDGTRFIVSYVNVPRFSTGELYTFQVILYPTGRIVYQYLSMQSGRLDEATIGIQNATRTDGLTIVHNADYVHDNLAIEIATAPDYLTVTPTSGSIPAGGSASLDVTFNTTGLFGGLYNGAIRISSNDPDEPIVSVSTALTAIGVPDIAAVPPSLDFGPVYVGLTRDLTVQVRNIGSDVLTVTGASPSGAGFSLVGGAFPITLGKNAAHTLTVRFAPGGACSPCAGTLDVASNDPDSPIFAVPLTGTGVIPPEIAVAPTSLQAALATTLGPTAIQTTKTLVIENTGGSDLVYQTSASETGPASTQTHDYLDLPKGEDVEGAAEPVDPRPGILGSGGPDAFGYTWKDSDEPGGPTFSWVDIKAVGTPTDFPPFDLDGNFGPYPIGFNFPFYGNTFTEFHVCDNGWISFTNGTLETFTNQALPNAAAAVPENMLAVWWDDMVFDLSDSNYVKYHNDGTRLIVEYFIRRVGDFTPPFYNYQIILYPNGDIVYQYKTMDTNLTTSTIGIQNATKNDGLMVVFNSAYMHDGLAIKFSSRPPWLNVSPQSGVIPAGGSATLTVGFDATELEDGDYDGVVRIASNDLDEPVVGVPCDLHVGVAAAAFDLDPGTFNRTSGGQWVKGLVTPPASGAPQDIVLSSVLVQRTVPVAPGAPVSYGPTVAEYKFDRTELQAVLPNGENVPVEVIGRVGDVTWFAGWDTVRVYRPGLRAASYGAESVGGGFSVEQVQSASTVALHFDDPDGVSASWFDLWYSENRGESWTLVEGGITARDYSWVAPAATEDAMLDLVAYDGQGVMGSFLTPVFEVLGGTTAVEAEAGPDRLALRFAGRNPGRHAQLEIGVATRGPVKLEVFDLRGALVRTVADREFEPGWHPVQWDARDAAGLGAEPGLYFLRVRTARETATSRFVLVR